MIDHAAASASHDRAPGWYDIGDGWASHWDGAAWSEAVDHQTLHQAMAARAAGPSTSTDVVPSPAAAAAVSPVFASPPAPPPPPAPVPSPVAGPGNHRAAGGRQDVPAFFFDGGAASYVGTGILAFLVTVFTLGLALPFALVLRERWKARHTWVEGRRLMFTGSGMSLFGHWLLWMFLTGITFGIYGFWVVPKLTKWRVEHLAFDPRG